MGNQEKVIICILDQPILCLGTTPPLLCLDGGVRVRSTREQSDNNNYTCCMRIRAPRRGKVAWDSCIYQKSVSNKEIRPWNGEVVSLCLLKKCDAKIMLVHDGAYMQTTLVQHFQFQWTFFNLW